MLSRLMRGFVIRLGVRKDDLSRAGCLGSWQLRLKLGSVALDLAVGCTVHAWSSLALRALEADLLNHSASGNSALSIGTQAATRSRQPCWRTNVLLYRAHVDVATVEHAVWELGGKSKGEEVREACGQLCKPPSDAARSECNFFLFIMYVFAQTPRQNTYDPAQ